MPSSFVASWINPPKDFSLDLFAVVMAQKAGLEVIRIPVRFDKRMYGSSKWNNGLRSRIKFIERTIRFSITLRRSFYVDH
jgi:hypothetical protein